jgi:GNAT superfamily N-acetyltransferase
MTLSVWLAPKTVPAFRSMNQPTDPSSPLDFQPATVADLQPLQRLIRKYYEFDGILYREQEVAAGLKVLLNNDTVGRAWLVRHRATAVGYAILTFGFDLEFGGHQATMTDLYLEPEYRGKGAGRKLVGHVQEFCRKAGVCALELQAERHNSHAIAFYKSCGFELHDRVPMSKRIDA